MKRGLLDPRSRVNSNSSTTWRLDELITSTSFSRLQVYEACPKRAQLAFIEKIQEPKSKGESPLDRGSRIHDDAEQFVRGTKDLVHELKNFEEEFQALRKRYTEQPDSILLEELWCFNDGWVPVKPDDWDNIWLRVKTDAIWFLDNDRTEAVVVDYKTGKKVRNEVKHGEQLQLYQLGAFIRFPTLEKVHTELWYLDQNETTEMSFTRNQGMKFLKSFNKRFLSMTSAEEFPPRPSTHACMFCPFKTGMIGKKGPKGTGHCGLNPV